VDGHLLDIFNILNDGFEKRNMQFPDLSIVDGHLMDIFNILNDGFEKRNMQFPQPP
jgi:cobalamin-dependent methionine synthase I